MGLFDFRKKKPDEAASPPTSSAVPPTPPASVPAAAETPNAPAFIEATDAFGRRVRLSREEYRDKVLPELLKAHGNDPERLTGVILQGLRDGLARELIAAANRLTVIDKDIERALSVLGVVQRDAGDLEAAEFSMRELLQKRPQSCNARVGLAMLADKRGETARCEQLLWEALQIDSNHSDAVHCWLQVQHRRVGDDGYRSEVEKAAALPGAWRARLWLARLDLQQGRDEEAVATYREVLQNAGAESDALLMASGDLVRGKQHDLVRELIAPRFQPGRHHPHVGLALLHHFVETQDHVAGASLLHQMHLHYGHLVANELAPFTQVFDRLRLQKLPAPPPLSGTPRIGLYRFDRPLWCAGLEDPQWLLPKKSAAARHVMFLALSVDGQPQVPAGQEDELGRTTRSVPMWLAEHVWLSTPHRGTAALPLADQGGWVVMARPWPEEQVIQQLGAEERQNTILVTGVLRVDGDKRRIDMWAFDCALQKRIGHAAAEGTAAELGKMLLQLLGELLPALGGPAGHVPPIGDEAFWHRYAESLAQHAALVVTHAGGMPKERLYGERNIAQWVQHTALQEPRWQPSFWLYASTLRVLQMLGSLVVLEHARTVAELFRQSPPATAFARLAVLPLRAVGLDAVWQARRAEIVAAAGGDPAYAAWLQRVEGLRQT